MNTLNRASLRFEMREVIALAIFAAVCFTFS